MSYTIQDLVIRNVAPGDYSAEIISLVGRSEVGRPGRPPPLHYGRRAVSLDDVEVAYAVNPN